MEYTVQKLAKLAGVSARTLRYYDQIGLLRPARMSSSGYRIYGASEVNLLQQILLYREMDMPLEQIAQLLANPGFDRLAALRGHRRRLIEKRARLDLLLQTVEKTIHATEGGNPMEDNEKFSGLKQALIDKNEERYGAEIRQKYGDKTVDASNRRLLNLSKEQYEEMEYAGAQVLRLLDAAYETGDPSGAAAMELARTHKRWLGFTWASYSPEAHIGLGEMYVADERFAAYYDRGTAGKAAFLRDAIVKYCTDPQAETM